MSGAFLVKQIWDLCRIKGISKSKFYADTGITPAAVSYWKNGVNLPTASNLNAIADYLDVTPAYLLLGNDQKEIPTSVLESGDMKEFANAWFKASPESRKVALDALKLGELPPEDREKLP